MERDKPIKSTEQGFDCCKRYYYYGKHNYKCRQINNLKEDEEVPLFITKPNEKTKEQVKEEQSDKEQSTE